MSLKDGMEAFALTLKLHLLGQVYMEKDGARVALPFKKAEAVVLYIAIEGPRPVEKVKCLFWGDSSERQAAGSLRNAVYLLRKLLPENFEACDGRLFLKNYTTDVDQLCTLRDCETPAVVFDEPLCGFESLTLPDFDEWLAYAAGRVRERLVRWLWDKAAASAVEEKSRAEALAAVLRLDPFDEEAALELMKSHIAQGKAAKAVCLYETFCARLMSEARVPPGPALRAFAEQTALELTDKRWHADEIFCGRCAELKKLADTARRQQGRLQLYFIHGEAGVGKTALVRRAVGSMSGEDAPVFTASAVSVGEKFAYSAWENIVSQLVNRLRESGMTPPAEDISVLSRYFYELAKCENYCAVLLPRGRETLTIARILARFAERLSRGRRAFFIFEDLHWFDALSMKLLRLFIAELRTQTTVFMTSRPQSAATVARTLYGVKPAVPHSLLILPLAPFTRDEIMQYCRLLLSDSLINEKGEGYFVRESEGMPLLLVEMTKMLAENKDADCRCGLRGLIMARMAELSEKEREILDLLSVFGGPVCAEDIAAAAETGAEAALAAVEELLRMGMIRETEEDGGCALDFLHVNVRECVYDAIPGFKRKRLHQRVAKILRRRYSPHRWNPALSARLCHHYKIAGDHIAFLEQHLLEMKYHVNLNRRLFPMIQDGVLRQCSLLFGTREEGEAKIANIRDFLHGCGYLDRIDADVFNKMESSFCEMYGGYLINWGDYEKGRKLTDAALKTALAHGFHETALHCMEDVAHHYLQTDESAALRETAEKILNAARELEKENHVGLALRLIGISQLTGGDYAGAEETFLRSIRVFEELELAGKFYTLNLLAPRCYIGEMRQWSGQTQYALEQYEYCVARCEKAGLFWGQSHFHAHAADAALDMGDWPRLTAHVRRGAALFESSRGGHCTSILYSLKAICAAEAGDFKEAASALEKADFLCAIGKKSWRAAQSMAKAWTLDLAVQNNSRTPRAANAPDASASLAACLTEPCESYAQKAISLYEELGAQKRAAMLKARFQS